MISNDAPPFAYNPDPSDELDYGFDASALLDGETIIAGSVVVTLDDVAAGLGVAIVADGPHAPAVDPDGVTIVFWIAVDPAHQEDSAFDRFGVELAVTVAFTTSHSPPRRFERSAELTMRSR